MTKAISPQVESLSAAPQASVDGNWIQERRHPVSKTSKLDEKRSKRTSICLRLRTPATGARGGSSHQLVPGIEAQGASLLAQVLDVFADWGVVVESVTSADEPTPLECKYFGGQPMYLRRDLEVVWRNSYRGALRHGFRPWQAERIAWNQIKRANEKANPVAAGGIRKPNTPLTGQETNHGA